MKRTIQDALTKAGCTHLDPTYENLKSVFLDYVDSGYFRNLDYDEAVEMIEEGDITEQEMIDNLCKRN